MLLTAAAHTAGNLAAPPGDASEQKVFAAMESLRTDMGLGMSPSVKDIYWCLTFIMSVTLTALGLLNLTLAAAKDASDLLLRRVSWVNLLWVTAFVIVCWTYRIPPPLLSGLVIDVFVVASLIATAGKLLPRQ